MSLHPVICAFLPDCSAEEQVLVRSCCELKDVAAGAKLFAAGDNAHALYIILQGKFAVHGPAGVTGRSQVVALLERGAILGEGALIDEWVRGASVVALENGEVACLSRQSLQRLEVEAPSLYIRFLKKVAAVLALRLRKSTERLALVL